jgi:signal transduction histidine kinase
VTIRSWVRKLFRRRASSSFSVHDPARQQGPEPSWARSTVQATLSHELRTALNAILGYSEMLQEEAQALGRPQFVADLEKIQRAGKHLLAVFTDLLERSRLEAGEVELHPETAAVLAPVSEVMTTVRPRWQ